MTEEQKQTIVRLRDMGLGYRKIGIALDIPRDKVRNYCKEKGMDGYAKSLIENKEWKQMEKECPETVGSVAIQSKSNQMGGGVFTVQISAEGNGA